MAMASSASASTSTSKASHPAVEPKSMPTLPPMIESMAHDTSDADLPPLPTDQDDSFVRHNLHQSPLQSDGSALEDHEMKRQLMDIESSFLPEPSAQAEAIHAHAGADDTFLFGGSPGNARSTSDAAMVPKVQADNKQLTDSSILSEEPPTPADAYKTPAARRLLPEHVGSAETGAPTSDATASSPLAEAARRYHSRATLGTGNLSEAQNDAAHNESEPVVRPTSSASTVKAPEAFQADDGSSITDDAELSVDIPTSSIGANNKRPSYLHQRRSSQRSSVSSFTNRSDISGDGVSTASLGADYALQTGGAVPRSGGAHRNSVALSRLPSLGSIASSMSVYSESNAWEKSWEKTRGTSTNSTSGFLQSDGSLARLEEEAQSSMTPPETPRATHAQASAPTDTVIARHVQNIHVPDTIAREFREKHSRSPDKQHVATPFTRTKHNLTLKEQNSKIDKLSKENFDLKLKIHFLDQALQNRSDEGVKDMISKNVQLQTDLATEKKDNLSLRKKLRDLERRLKAHEEGLATTKDIGSGSEDGKSDKTLKQAELEEEIEFLRERLETTETIVEQWQQEALQKEADNRRMADYIKTMREKSPTGDSAGINEVINIWKEDFEDERARREQVEIRCQQAENESQSLREEVQRLREQNQQMQPHLMGNHQVNKLYNGTRRIHQSFADRSTPVSDSNDQAGPFSIDGTSSTLVEQLQNDNEKLQRDLHAQASMLTSRNRENLRLREENEGLKLTIRRGDVGSIAGDSILERSISRNHMRSVSRASGGTRVTQMSDPEREDIESKHAALRDELSQLKLSYKELDDQLNGHLDMLETAEIKIKELEQEAEAQIEDLQALANERDEALEILQDKEQECEELRQEALDTVQRLENELEQKQHEYDRMLIDLENTTEDFQALQQEMKSVSESLIQLEDDRDANLRKIQNLESELADANQELGRQDKLLNDERSKNERLDIQLESCQGEVDFLREEQEGDKIKIGELESAVNIAQVTIQDEKERYRDLQDRMGEEAQQRDALDSQEKQEVEKIITDLNTQLTKLKDDNRKLRKNFSSKDVEAATWKQRLDEFENSLRQAFGSLNATRSSLLKVNLSKSLLIQLGFNNCAGHRQIATRS